MHVFTTVNKSYMYVGDIFHHVNTNVFTCSARSYNMISQFVVCKCMLFDLGIGETQAIFHSLGTSPSLMEMLKS